MLNMYIMETINIPDDISLLYVTATSFPAGIMDAFNRLHALVQDHNTRMNYGISRPEKGTILYKAAVAEVKNGEADELKCGKLVLPKGDYISATITDLMKDTSVIGKTFAELLAHPGIDHNGYCVEQYINATDVVCMVRLSERK